MGGVRSMGTMWRLLRIATGWIVSLILWVWTIAVRILDGGGRLSMLENPHDAHALADRVLTWLLSTPWWVPAMLASVITIASIMFLFRAEKPRNGAPRSENDVVPTKFTDIPARMTATELRMLFTQGNTQPREIKRTNVLSWYAVWSHEVMARTIFEDGRTEDKLVYPRFWSIFLVFESPTNITQLLVEFPGKPPGYEVKFLSQIYAVITTASDIDPGLLVIKSND